MGNANLLGPVALLAIIVFAIRFAAERTAPRAARRVDRPVGLPVLPRRRPRRRTSRPSPWPSSSSPCCSCAARAGRASAPATTSPTRPSGSAARWRSGCCAIRSSRRSGAAPTSPAARRIWQAVLERAVQQPLIGWGYSTPWIAGRPGVRRVDHRPRPDASCRRTTCGSTCSSSSASIGVFLMGVLYLAFIWRSWFFAVDRPRWDLRADRPYSPLTLLPTLVGAILLVQGLAESSPLLLWGWLFVVMLAFKIKQSPHIGEGAAEHAHRDRAWRADHAGVVTRHAPRRRARGAGSALLASAALARAYTIAVLGAVVLGVRDRADRRTRHLRRRSSSGSACSASAMLVARRREISLVRLVPTTRGRCSSAWALASVFWSQDATGSFWSWVSTAGLAFLAVTIGHVRDTLQTARALGDVHARAAVDLARRRGPRRASCSTCRSASSASRATSRSSARSRASSARATCSGFVAVHRAHHLPDRVPHAVRARRACRCSRSCSPGGLAALSDSPTVLVLAVAVGLAVGALALVRHARPEGRSALQWTLGGIVVVGLAIGYAARHPIIALPRRRIRLLDASEPVEHDGRLPALQAGAGLGMVRAVEPERVPVQRDQLRACARATRPG